jgi:hypothetical protein
MDAAVVIEPYNPEWPSLFAVERELLAPVLAPWLAGPIEHVGSTAVPGLAAKPVIDIMAPVPRHPEKRENCEMIRLPALAFATLLALPPASLAASSQEYGLGDLGSLQIDLAPGWHVTRSPSGSGATISIEAAQPGSMQLLMTPLPGQPTDAEVREFAQHAADALGPQSVEKSLAVKSLRGPQAQGYYFKATDPAPKPREYRYLYQGAMRMRGIVVTFTVLYNDGAEHDAEAAVAAVRGMKLRSVPLKHSSS